MYPCCSTLLRQTEDGKYLIPSLHNVAQSFLALEKQAKANATANDVLERNPGRVIENYYHAPNFKARFVC